MRRSVSSTPSSPGDESSTEKESHVDLELTGKTFLITGGTDGLGLALATQLATEGAAVAVCGRDEERLRAAEAAVQAVGGDVLALQADVSRAGDLEALVEAAAARWGRIDGVVHNAGRASAGSIETIDDETWEYDLQLKLMAAVRLTRLALPYLRANDGAVVFTLALSAKAPGASSEPSSVTRAAGMALMKALSKELAPDGIRVNAILIGLIESGQWVRMAAASGSGLREFYDRFGSDAGIPLGRFGRADEFADLGCFLLSARASYLTGTAINLDGGMSPSV
jgi:NAD(P)-dependent dehydrogenase (short-subunit alcohol dehydrogenase family)